MSPKKLKTPLLDADRERRGRCYFAADLIFDDGITDEFSGMVPGELAFFVAKESSKFAKSGINISLVSVYNPVVLSVEVVTSSDMDKYPSWVKDKLETLLTTLQKKYLCSFDGAPYVSERLDTFLGKPFSVPVPTIELGSASGRRLVLQQMTAIRRDVDRQLAILTEREAELRGNNVLDEVMKAQQQTNYQTLRTALLEKKSQAETDMSGEILAALGKMSPDPNIGDIPQAEMSISSATGSTEKNWRPVSDDMERVTPALCETKNEILDHPIMQAALRKVYQGHEKVPSAILGEILRDPAQTEALVLEGQKILRRIHKKNPVTKEQIKLAVVTLFRAIEFALSSPGTAVRLDGTPNFDLEGFVKSFIHDVEDPYPEILFGLLYLVRGDKNQLPSGDWLTLALNLKNENLKNYVFQGKRLPEGVVTGCVAANNLKNFDEHWPSLGETYLVMFEDQACYYHKINGALRPMVITHGDKEFPVSELGEISTNPAAIKPYQQSIERVKKDIFGKTVERAIEVSKFPHVFVSSGEELESVVIHKNPLEPLVIDGELVSRYNNTLVSCSVAGLTQTIYQVELWGGKSFVEMERGEENQKYRLYHGDELISDFENIYVMRSDCKKEKDPQLFRFTAGEETFLCSLEGYSLVWGKQNSTVTAYAKLETDWPLLSQAYVWTNKVRVRVRDPDSLKRKNYKVKPGPQIIHWKPVDEMGTVLDDLPVINDFKLNA